MVSPFTHFLSCEAPHFFPYVTFSAGFAVVLSDVLTEFADVRVLLRFSLDCETLYPLSKYSVVACSPAAVLCTVALNSRSGAGKFFRFRK